MREDVPTARRRLLQYSYLVGTGLYACSPEEANLRYRLLTDSIKHEEQR